MRFRVDSLYWGLTLIIVDPSIEFNNKLFSGKTEIRQDYSSNQPAKHFLHIHYIICGTINRKGWKYSTSQSVSVQRESWQYVQDKGSVSWDVGSVSFHKYCLNCWVFPIFLGYQISSMCNLFLIFTHFVEMPVTFLAQGLEPQLAMMKQCH